MRVLDLIGRLTHVGLSSAVRRWRRRRERSETIGLAAVDAPEHASHADLEPLAALGRSLSGAVDATSLRQTFWRHMPGLVGGRSLWMLTPHGTEWEPVYPPSSSDPAPTCHAPTPAARAAIAGTDRTSQLVIEGDLCQRLVAASTTVGFLGVRDTPPLSAIEQGMFAAAAALLGMALRHGLTRGVPADSPTRDPVTRCFTLAYAGDSLAAELRHARRNTRPVAVVLLDVHPSTAVGTADAAVDRAVVIGAVGAKLSAMLRGTDIRCGAANGTFVLILPDTASAGASRVAASLIDAVTSLRVRIGTRTYSPTLSVGLTVAGCGDRDADEVLADAAAAAHAARRDGPNTSVVHPPVMAGRADCSMRRLEHVSGVTPDERQVSIQ